MQARAILRTGWLPQKKPASIRKGGLNAKLGKVTSTTPLSTSLWTGGFASPGLPGFAFSMAIDFGTKKHITALIATKLILKSEFVSLIIVDDTDKGGKTQVRRDGSEQATHLS